MATRWSLMGDLAVCYAATVVRPDGLGPLDKLVADFESRHRSANSAETHDQPLVIGVFRMANSRQNRVGGKYR
jgi:hypothetical protein